MDGWRGEGHWFLSGHLSPAEQGRISLFGNQCKLLHGPNDISAAQWPRDIQVLGAQGENHIPHACYDTKTWGREPPQALEAANSKFLFRT